MSRPPLPAPRWAAPSLVALLAVLAAQVWAPMLPSDRINHDQDYLRFVISRATAWQSLRLHELPLRTHQLGGGVPSVAHPHDAGLSPWLLLTWLAGPLLGSKLEYIASWLLGAAGTWLLAARALRLHWVASYFMTATAAGLPWAAHRALGGDVPELQYLLTPLLLALLLIGRRRPGAVPLAACVLASVALVGAYRTALIGAFAAAAVLLSTRRSTLRGDLEHLVVCGVGAALLAAPKLAIAWPQVRESFRWTTRWRQDHQAPRAIAELLLLPPTDPERLNAWSHYVGPIVLALAALGLGAGRRALPFAVLAGCSVWMIGGPHWPVDGFALLQRLPVFSAITAAPKQFSPFLLLCLVVLAGLGVERLARRVRPSLLVALTAAHALWLGSYGARLTATAFATEVRAVAPEAAHDALLAGDVVIPQGPSRPFETVALDVPRTASDLYVSLSSPVEHPHLLYTVLAGLAEPSWWDTFFPEGRTVPRARLEIATGQEVQDPQYRGEAWAQSGARCVQLRRITPRTLIAATDCPAPDVAVFNQNAGPGWSGPDGPAGRAGDLLAVAIPAGPHTVLLRYEPPAFRPALALAACGGVALALWWWRRGRLSAAAPAAAPSG